MDKKALPGIYPLKGAIQNYAWGGYEYIPELIGIDNVEQEPHAEYWVGVHPRGRAQIKVNGEWQHLDEYTRLPYLLKILDVRKMLSIQSHPNKQQAEIGYAKENEMGIPLDAKHRIFKDDNHKPELMMAIGDFWLLHGFKSIEDIRRTIQETTEFSSLLPHLDGGLKDFYSYLLNMSQGEVTATLTSLKMRLMAEEPTDKNHPDYWAYHAFQDYGFDKGIFSIYFYNLVYLSHGQGIYQEAGVPHAYLGGKNVEIMANSDNVFRAGLTPKHVDIEALLSHLVWEPVTPKIIEPDDLGDYEQAYFSPATEFELHMIYQSDGDTHYLQSSTDECYLLMEGEVIVESGDQRVHLQQGECLYATPDIALSIVSVEDSKLIRATLPKKG